MTDSVSDSVSSELLDWKDLVSKTDWSALLLGNGFSVNVWSCFSYGKLYDVARSGKRDCQVRDDPVTLNAQSQELFEYKMTTNFEAILELLLDAIKADEVTSGGNCAQLESLYSNVREALVYAVDSVHVPYTPEILPKICEGLLDYKSIFTTNYDLIPYWALMRQTDAFYDYLWDNGAFDPTDTVPSDAVRKRSRILYVHGALHLLVDTVGTVSKNQSKVLEGGADLLELFGESRLDERPLFISEGTAQEKLSRIHKNVYLNFAYGEFEAHNDSLVVLGQSLGDSDQHLVDAMKEWDETKKIAISVYPKQPSDQIIQFKVGLMERLSQHELFFFDSTTHPLGDAGLQVKDHEGESAPYSKI